MGAWIGCYRCGNAATSRPTWAPSLVPWPGEEVRLDYLPQRGSRLTLGDPEEAGCEVLAPGDGTLRLRTDPFGLRGIYALRVEESLWLASDPRLLRKVSGSSQGLQLEAIHGYLCLSHVPAPLTPTPGISILPPASDITLDAVPLDQNSWHFGADSAPWREAELRADPEEVLASELRDLLTASVRRRLNGAAEAAVFLSGGLDSSLVAALLAREGVKLHLFTLDFGPPFNQELEVAQEVAQHLGFPLHVVPADGKRVRTALEPAAAALALPFGDGVVVPLYLLGGAARDHCGVVFNGEGGDQLFGGWANKPILAAEAYQGEAYRREDAYLATYHRFGDEASSLFAGGLQGDAGRVDPRAWVRPALEGSGFPHLLHRLRAANLRLKGAQNIAPRSVQLVEAHGLTVHAPFFDSALARWSFALPPQLLLRDACEKYLLKRAAEPLLPASVVWREKRGMGVPISEWCRGPLRPEVARRLNGWRMLRNGWFDPRRVGAVCKAAPAGAEYRDRRWGERLWALLMLHVWAEVQSPAVSWHDRIREKMKA